MNYLLIYAIFYFTDILPSLWKEGLNSDGQQFHLYQQSKQSPLTLIDGKQSKNKT